MILLNARLQANFCVQCLAQRFTGVFGLSTQAAQVESGDILSIAASCQPGVIKIDAGASLRDAEPMLAEYHAIVDALQRLRDAAQRAGRSEIVDFTQQMMQHARTDEEVMYPAAILVGKFVRQRLGQPKPAAG